MFHGGFFLHCRVVYCEGKFPEFMLDAWDEYDYRKDSDNDRPGITGTSPLCGSALTTYSSPPLLSYF